MLTPPRGLSQPATSFIASYHQGIHLMLLLFLLVLKIYLFADQFAYRTDFTSQLKISFLIFLLYTFQTSLKQVFTLIIRTWKLLYITSNYMSSEFLKNNYFFLFFKLLLHQSIRQVCKTTSLKSRLYRLLSLI